MSLVVIVGFVVMGGQNVYNLFLQTFNIFRSLWALGWLFFVVTIFISYMSVKSIKKYHQREIEFLENEYKLLENKNTGIKIKEEDVKSSTQRKSHKK